MAQNMHVEHEFECSAEALFNLLTSPEFDDKLMAAIDVKKEILSEEETDDGKKLRLRMSPNTDLPGFMKKVVGGSNDYKEVRTWSRSKLGNTWEIEPSIAGGKVDIKGTLSIKSTGDNTCKRVIDGSFSVRLPLIGKKIESFIIKQTLDSFEGNAAFVRKYISENDV